MAEVDKQKIIKTIVGVVVGIAAYFAVQQLFFRAPSFDKQMMAAASELNESCPMMVDAETRLDNAVAMPDNVFQYNYTMINIKKEDLDVDVFTNELEPFITNSVKTNPDLQVYRDNKVTMAYYYQDMEGEFLTKIVVTPDEYEP